MKIQFLQYLNRMVWMLLAPLIMILSGCSSDGTKKGSQDSTTSGIINISADESFKPVIDSQIQVFESQNPDAKIIVHYKPEAECLRDLNVDSIRMVIVTRGLTEGEAKTLTERYTYKPGWGPLAFDAIAVLVNSKSKDSLFTMQDIRGMVKGISGYKYKVLVDGTKSTSTVRFLTDSLLKGQPMGKNVVAASSSQDVIDYVANNTDAIGLVGVSWVGNREDSTQLSFLKKVKIAQIECRGCNGTYVDPVQYNIATNRYPMIRTLWYILKENYDGLGNGFTNFLIYEKGQRIFSRAYLWPARMNFEVRKTNLE